MALGDYMGVQCHACIGGTSVREDMRKLEAGQHIVVGTPGRVFDMISRKPVLIEFVSYCLQLHSSLLRFDYGLKNDKYN